MKKLFTIILCLSALALFSCEDSSEDVFKEIDTEINGDFDSSESSKNDDFDSGNGQ